MADFEQSSAAFRALDVALIAASVEGEENARKTVDELKLSFPVACGVVAERLSAATGAHFDPEKMCLHATGFILRPDLTVAGAVYSTGPVGRYTAADALAIIKSWTKK